MSRTSGPRGRRSRVPLLALVAMLLALLVAAGCGSDDESGGSSAGGGESAATDSQFAKLYEEVSKLQGEEAVKFFESLPSKGVEGEDIIKFFIDLPISDANAEIAKLYNDEGFERYLSGYPRGEPHEGFNWEPGMGTKISGAFSKNALKLPFTDYIPLAEGPIGDANETYNIGVTFHGFDHPWLINGPMLRGGRPRSTRT